jgi:hypothetical protein
MKIHFIFTASIGGSIKNSLEGHEEEIYVERIRDTIQKLSEFPVDFYVVENNGKRPTLLDTIERANILYTDTNKNDWPIGTKEFLDIQTLCQTYEFADEDIVIKLTGRYLIAESSLIEKILDYEDSADVFMKFYDASCDRLKRDKWKYNDCVLGLYGIRYSVLKEFKLELLNQPLSPEIIFASYIRQTVEPQRIMEIKMLDIYFRGDKGYRV